MEVAAERLFEMGHLPIVGEWLSFPLIERSGSTQVGDAGVRANPAPARRAAGPQVRRRPAAAGIILPARTSWSSPNEAGRDPRAPCRRGLPDSRSGQPLLASLAPLRSVNPYHPETTPELCPMTNESDCSLARARPRHVAHGPRVVDAAGRGPGREAPRHRVGAVRRVDAGFRRAQRAGEPVAAAGRDVVVPALGSVPDLDRIGQGRVADRRRRPPAAGPVDGLRRHAGRSPEPRRWSRR